MAVRLVTFILAGWLTLSLPVLSNPSVPEHNYHAIVSLAPSNTELIYSLAAQDSLVGVSSHCDFPPETGRKPKAGSFVSANFETLSRLHPDLILLVSGQEALAATLSRHGYTTRVLANESLSGLSANITEIGRLTGKEARAKLLTAHLEQSLTSLAAILSQTKERPSVLMAVWPEPLIVAGKASFLDQVITTCGGTNSTAFLSSAYPQLNKERLMLTAPQVVFLPSEAASQDFWKKTPWTLLPAVRKKRLYFLPAQAQDRLFRPTLRLLDGLAWLSLRLHPESTDAINKWSQCLRNWPPAPSPKHSRAGAGPPR